MRLASITPVIRFGDGSHFDNTGDGHVMQGEAACFDTLDVAGDVQRVAHGAVSRRYRGSRPGDGLPATPFAAYILDQVMPDASPGSANVLG